MRYLVNTSTDPYFNLALDEYAMQNIDVGEDYFFLWQNKPAIIIGKNQNTLEEINPQFVEDMGITVARRVSGGGAVFQDFGNLNFTIITNIADVNKVDFKKYVQPVIKALESMGVKAEASGRNDILIDGRKISGNAQRQEKGRLMHHGTLMFDVNVEHMVRALNVAEDKFISKAAKSVRSRVTNIKDYLPEGTTLTAFWEQLHYYLSNEGQDQEIILSDEQRAEVARIAQTKYAPWDWIYAKSPAFNYRNSERFSGGKIDVMVDVDEGHIKSVRFLGDYLGVNDVSEVETKLLGTRYVKDDVKQILEQLDFASYFGTITVDEVLRVLFE